MYTYSDPTLRCLTLDSYLSQKGTQRPWGYTGICIWGVTQMGVCVRGFQIIDPWTQNTSRRRKDIGHASRKFDCFNGRHFLLCNSEKLDSPSVMKLDVFRRECNFMVAAV